MGIADARRARDEQAALIGRGLDPAHERRRAAALSTITLESTTRAWDASRAGKVDEHTRRTAMRRLEMYIFPTLGARHPRSITPSDLLTALDPLVAADQRETANRTAAVLDTVFVWAEIRGDASSNPAKLVKRAYPKAPTKHYAAIVEPAAFGGLLRASTATPASSCGKRFAAHLHLLGRAPRRAMGGDEPRRAGAHVDDPC